MRIIAGTARSRAIKAPKGMDTRPTLDRVRETIFNILQFDVKDARVLDLYAGSGALALEALSRGAEHACLVDMAHAAQKGNEHPLGGEACIFCRHFSTSLDKAFKNRRFFYVLHGKSY